MINLPVDLIRHTYKLLLWETPLSIFTFEDEMFEKGEYIEEEKVKLMIDSIKRHYELTNVPFFELIQYCYIDKIDSLKKFCTFRNNDFINRSVSKTRYIYEKFLKINFLETILKN
jgi:hypothetical protein